MGRKQELGTKGENYVAKYLTSNGYEILDCNWRIREGEIDLIAKSPDGRITFVEVKTRSSEHFGHPLESITKEKAHRLQKLALAWLVLNNKFGEDFKIDCASVILKNGNFEIDYRSDVL